MKLLINYNGKLQLPIVVGSVKLDRQLNGIASKLTFTVKPDESLIFDEGDPVLLEYKGVKVFYGFVFKKERKEDKIITVTAYDQLRYLTNKTDLHYQNLKASEVIGLLARQYKLNAGDIADTAYKIPSRIENNKSLNEIIQTALDLTMISTGKKYILYDDFGNLTLKGIGELNHDLIIDESTAEGFSYSSSIESDVYNKIKVISKSGKISIKEDTKNIDKWGVLQKTEKVDSLNTDDIANNLLKLHNQKRRKLSIKGALGDPNIRAGSLINVALVLGDVVVKNKMFVENVIHDFGEHHFMDLKLKGGDING